MIQPRNALHDTQEQLSIASAERDQAKADLSAAKTQAMMAAIIGRAQADVAKEAAAGRQVVAAKAQARDIQTTTIRERIVERVATKSDALVGFAAGTVFGVIGMALSVPFAFWLPIKK